MRQVKRQRIFERDGFSCIYCGASPIREVGTVLHLDHVVPVVYGGSNTASNVVTACSSCNLTKSVSVAEASVILPELALRNEASLISPESPVEGVREVNADRSKQKKVVSIRLSDEDEAYCEKHGENASVFVRSLIDYHKKETLRRESEKARLDIVIAQEKEAAQERAKELVEKAITPKMRKISELKQEISSVKVSLANRNEEIATLVLGKKYRKPTDMKPKTPEMKVKGEFDFENSVRDISEL